ncbi:class I SAM-dependent methyltransferase [Clostridium hydrogeniformans]|uniref:class I SAM-dependent methyltransferase n=1 Tax=Clostridium hydrogeniformans TaxID=349933 RepID=UPI00068D2FFA|nr:class I SAM-dependent methyltransferase [Clostridium hydrogeniformans]
MKYYGNLCTMMYDLDKPHAPKDELEFYMSYVEDIKMKILEPLCGSGRFLIPFLEKGYDITGFDISEDMINSLKEKAKVKNLNPKAYKMSMEEFNPSEKFDFIMIPCSSFSLLLEKDVIINSLKVLKNALKPGGKLLFGVETLNSKGEPVLEFKTSKTYITPEGHLLMEKSKNIYDDNTKILSIPLFYELYDGDKLIETEDMDFKIKLYDFKEMDEYLKEVGFETYKVYNSYNKDEVNEETCETLLYECIG